MARSLIGLVYLAWGLLTAQPCMAQENKAGIDAAFAILHYIFESEATLQTCSQVDSSNSKSYYATNQSFFTFFKRVYGLQLTINRVLHWAARPTDQGKDYVEAAEEQKETIEDEMERTAAANPDYFRSRCRALPAAVLLQSDPFQPIDKKFPAEINIVENWAAVINELPPAAMAPRDEASCETQGGEWGPLGDMRNRIGCKIPYFDGGKTCSDSSECQGRCIFENQLENYLAGKPVKEFGPGEPVTGICARWRVMFGCFRYVRKGKVVSGPCID